MTTFLLLALLAAPPAPAPAPAAPAPAAPAAAAAPTPAAPAAALRPAEAVLADYARAVGGEKAWKRHRSLYTKRSVAAKGMAINGTEEHYATAAGKSLTISAIPGMGRFRLGTDGTVRWADDPINGLRILTGVEDEEARIEATWNADLQLARSYAKVRSVPPPQPPPAGQRYECVELSPKVAPPAIACFDATTHLRVLQKGTRASPQGPVPYVTKLSDWREVQGIKLPWAEETTAGSLTMEAQVLEVKLDRPIDPKLFAVPKAGGGGGASAK
jgi:hypothetical protein